MTQVNTIDITKIVFHQLVGDWSQEIHLCSYNESDVFDDILYKTANLSFLNAFGGDEARASLNKSYPGVVDWQQLFDDLIALHKGWPEHYSTLHTPFKDLPEYHQKVIQNTERQDLLDMEMPMCFEPYDEKVIITQLIPDELIDGMIATVLPLMATAPVMEAYHGISDQLPRNLQDRVNELIKSDFYLSNIGFDKEHYMTLSFR